MMQFCPLSAFSSESNTFQYNPIIFFFLLLEFLTLKLNFIVDVGFYFRICFSVSVLVIIYCILELPYGTIFLYILGTFLGFLSLTAQWCSTLSASHVSLCFFMCFAIWGFVCCILSEFFKVYVEGVFFQRIQFHFFPTALQYLLQTTAKMKTTLN